MANVPGSPFDDLIGTEWLSDDPGDARGRVPFRDDLRQPYGLLHGGVYSTLVESVCSRATAIAVWGDGSITFGQALAKALGDKQGVRRYGHAYVPLDEALSRVVVDLSGRPGLEFHATFTRGRVGEFDVDLVYEFCQGLVNHAKMTLHIDNLRGRNAHHQVETIFKAFGRALRVAVEADPRAAGLTPSTKGSL